LGAEKYRKNLDNFLTVNEKAKAKKAGLNASSPSSLNLVVLFEYYAKNKHPNLQLSPSYPRNYVIGKKTRKFILIMRKLLEKR